MMEIQEYVPLAPLSSYRIGGPARYFCEPSSLRELTDAFEFARTVSAPFVIFGGATNLLISDRGVAGVVIRPQMHALARNGNCVKVGASVLVKTLLDFLVAEELQGMEWAGGLPGTVGGAIRGNAGCFGGEIEDSVTAVESVHANSLQRVSRDREACRFGYRTSVFKEHGDEVIVEAELTLRKGDQSTIAGVVQKNTAYRMKNHPMEYPNTGSVFKNIDAKHIPAALLPRFSERIKQDPFPILPAAHVIGQAGLKGVSYGGAMISPRHANFIVNVLQASAADVEALIALAKTEVQNQFGMLLEEEIQRIS